MVTRENTYRQAFEIKKNLLKAKEQERNMMLSAAYNSNPKLKDIECQLASLGAALAINALSGNNKTIEEIKKQSKALSFEKSIILEKSGVREIVYDCPLCNDSGYVGGNICECVKKIASSIAFSELTKEMPLDDCKFENFDLKYYSEKTDESGNNPRRRMTGILKLCREYVINFNPLSSQNLLFMGQAGLGKTHLTLAIIADVVQKGFLPIYGPAENLFSKIEAEKFSGENKGTYDDMINCDLLVIDDLGTEMVTSFTKSALYNLINTRMLSKKPTIINTNLSMKEIEAKYTARISSRLIGNYDAHKFLGDDIRQQKILKR